MKAKLSLLLAGALLAIASPAFADDALQAKYDEKIAKAFVAHGGWILDYDEARAKAKKEGKVIFTYFTRSYSP